MNTTMTDPDKLSIPFRCPVCNGNGLVPPGFYGQTSGNWIWSPTIPETCRSCNGTGIVWSNVKVLENSKQNL